MTTNERMNTRGFVPSDAEMQALHKALGEQTSAQERFAASAPEVRDTSGGIDTIMAVADHLLISSGLTQEEQQMVSETVLWIQEVAKGLARQDGWESSDFADPEKLVGPYYWDCLTKAAGNYCPWVQLNSQKFHQYSAGLAGEETVVNAPQTVCGAMLGNEAAQELAALSALLAGSPDGEVSRVADFFWNSKAAKNNQNCWSMGPVVGGQYDCWTCIALTFMGETPPSWRSLFVSTHYTPSSLTVSGLVLAIMLDPWRKVKSTVEAKLGQLVNQEIVEASID